MSMITCSSAVAARPLFAGRVLARPSPQRLGPARFKKDDKPEQPEQAEKPAKKSAADKQVDVALTKLRAADPAIARQVLKAWGDAGVKDAKGVRRAVYRAGISTVGIVALQSLVEAIAAFCSFQTAAVVSSQDFPGHFIVAFLVYSLANYFLIGVFFDLFTIGASVTSTVLLGTKSDAIFESVEALATGRTGLGLVDKANQAIDSGKLVLALNSIANALKAEDNSASFSVQTFQRLGALMVLRDAEENQGFKTSNLGISEDEALRVAVKFASFDSNDDRKLELSEFKRLCDSFNYTLRDDELRAALKILDKNGDGYIEFDEFCEWWVSSGKKEMAIN